MKKKNKEIVKRWNEKYPTGTPVIVTRDNGDKLKTVTRSEAWELCGHVSVLVAGISGGYAIERVTPNFGVEPTGQPCLFTQDSH